MNIIIVTPAGRKRYLKILIKYLEKQKTSFDEWHLWENTRNIDDYKYLQYLEDNYDFVKIIKRNIPIIHKGKNQGICYFWDYPNDPDTYYIRLDDDIVYLENNFIENLINFRKNNTNYSLVYANIVNNNIIDHIHQQNGAINLDVNINYSCMGNSWKSKEILIKIHKQFIESIKKNELYRWKFDRWILNYYERVSINAICWKGGDMNNFKGITDFDEEHWISETYPESSKTPSVICGNALCAHAGFYTQRSEELEILIQEYEKYV